MYSKSYLGSFLHLDSVVIKNKFESFCFGGSDNGWIPIWENHERYHRRDWFAPAAYRVINIIGFNRCLWWISLCKKPYLIVKSCHFDANVHPWILLIDHPNAYVSTDILIFYPVYDVMMTCLIIYIFNQCMLSCTNHVYVPQILSYAWFHDDIISVWHCMLKRANSAMQSCGWSR